MCAENTFLFVCVISVGMSYCAFRRLLSEDHVHTPAELRHGVNDTNLPQAPQCAKYVQFRSLTRPSNSLTLRTADTRKKAGQCKQELQMYSNDIGVVAHTSPSPSRFSVSSTALLTPRPLSRTSPRSVLRQMRVESHVKLFEFASSFDPKMNKGFSNQENFVSVGTTFEDVNPDKTSDSSVRGNGEIPSSWTNTDYKPHVRTFECAPHADTQSSSMPRVCAQNPLSLPAGVSSEEYKPCAVSNSFTVSHSEYALSLQVNGAEGKSTATHEAVEHSTHLKPMKNAPFAGDLIDREEPGDRRANSHIRTSVGEASGYGNESALLSFRPFFRLP